MTLLWKQDAKLLNQRYHKKRMLFLQVLPSFLMIIIIKIIHFDFIIENCMRLPQDKNWSLYNPIKRQTRQMKAWNVSCPSTSYQIILICYSFQRWSAEIISICQIWPNLYRFAVCLLCFCRNILIHHGCSQICWN